jgi:Tol biopolymer transport system component
MTMAPEDMAGAVGDLGSSLLDLSGNISGDMPSGARHQIAFYSQRALDGSDTAGAAINIWVVNDDGSGAMPLTNDTMAVNLYPAWSPDGNELVFISSRAADAGGGGYNIWRMNGDGSGAVALTHLSLATFLQASWSPDGTKIVYVSNRALDGSDSSAGNIANIWVMNADGSGSMALTHSTVGNIEPVWSPNGARVAYSAAGTAMNRPQSNIHVVNADGSGDQAVSSYVNVTERGPSWSPDGTKIAFYSDGTLDGNDAVLVSTQNVWVADVSGAVITHTPLTHAASNTINGLEIWSAANRIFFYSNLAITDGGTAGFLWSMNGDGSNQAPLVPSAEINVWRGITFDAQPAAWNKDGSALAFVFKAGVNGSPTANAAENIWVVGADGSGLHPVTRVTAASTDCLAPVWRP